MFIKGENRYKKLNNRKRKYIKHGYGKWVPQAGGKIIQKNNQKKIDKLKNKLDKLTYF